MEFNQLWDLHYKWSKGSQIKEIIRLDTADVYISDIPGDYFNFAVPTVIEPSDLNLPEIKNHLYKHGRKLAFYLSDNHQKSHFTEFLIRNGLYYQGVDTWMLLNKTKYSETPNSAEISLVTPETFNDFRSVLSEVFFDFHGNDSYLEMCLKSITSSPMSPFVDLKSELFLIYNSRKPAAGAGLFYSKQADIAYLHNDGSLKEFRGKGYQSSLIKYRVNIALRNGISNIYSSVELGSKSWSNYIKSGFDQFPTSIIVSEK